MNSKIKVSRRLHYKSHLANRSKVAFSLDLRQFFFLNCLPPMGQKSPIVP